MVGYKYAAGPSKPLHAERPREETELLGPAGMWDRAWRGGKEEGREVRAA